MIQYFRSTSYKKQAVLSENLLAGSWVRVERPTDEEIDNIVDQFQLDRAIVDDALDPHEVPRIEAIDNNIYFITRLPDTDDDFNDFTTPITFVIHPKYIITISRDSLTRLWQPFIDSSTIITNLKTQALILMMEAIIQEYQRKVAAINRQIRVVSSDIMNLRPKDITIIVEHERKLNDYLDALLPSNAAVEKLLGGKVLRLFEDDRDLVEGLSVEFEQIITRCKSLLRTITNVRDSFRAVMDTRLNETIRLLTVITLAFTVPTMLAGLYGMNVELPGQEASPLTFWGIILVSFCASSILSFYFLYKRR